MTQLLIRTSDGLVTTVLPSSHVWGKCECWPSFVVLNVEGLESAIIAAIDANRDADGVAHVALDSLRDQVVTALAKDDRATIPLRELEFSAGAESSKLTAATAARLDEKAAFQAWHATLGAVGDAPSNPERRAAEQAARAELASKRGGGGGANAAPPKKARA